jgi:murein DD-endopeptidase MepM/ murein hydrolase activator NlpD
MSLLKKLCPNSDLKSCKPAWVVASVSVFVTVLGIGGFGFSKGYESAKAAPMKENVALRDALKRQKADFGRYKQKEQAHLDALALKLGKLQAQLIRLEALGSRLTEVGNLNPKEFDFNNPPPQGGPVDLLATSVSNTELMKSIGQLSSGVHDRGNKLNVLEGVLLNRTIKSATMPSVYPARVGFVSSKFGSRKDPFTGKKTYHKGVDIAGKSGSDILAVAAGVVTFSAVHGGHGRMVEIAHGRGLVTRYAHNLLNLVDVGDTVKKGEVIALMGQSGRATGSHTHFEVMRDNKHVNPERYLRSRK